METPPADYDGAWKETLELYWRPFMELCFPDIADDIDWSQPVEFLDKELQDVVRAADSGRRFVDKLVKVIRRSGQSQWCWSTWKCKAIPTLVCLAGCTSITTGSPTGTNGRS